MRKVILSLILGLLLGGIHQLAQAQGKTLEFNLNAGAIATYKFIDVLFTSGVGLDYHMGEHIMVSPELQLWSYQLNPRLLQLNLGATLNCKLKYFFFGGGVSLRLFQTEDITDVFGISGLKINAGFRIKRIKLTIYLLSSFHGIFPSLERVYSGANIGIVF